MPDTTDIYGIRFPQDGDSIDTAGDMRQLAETSEIALGGVNWDTATDEQKAAVAASTAPVSLFGTGRPDAAGDNIQAPTGSTYTFAGNETELEAVVGARVWQKMHLRNTDDTYSDKWVCVEGTTPRARVEAGDSWSGSGGMIVVVRHGETVMVEYASTYVAAQTGMIEKWAAPATRQNGEFVPCYSGGTNVGYCSFDFQTTGYIGFSASAGLPGSYSPPRRQAWNYHTNNPWPTTDDKIDTAGTLAEELAKDVRRLAEEIENDPDKAEQLEQLRQELEALQAEAGE